MFVLELLNCATLDPTEATTSRAMKIVFIIFLISSPSKRLPRFHILRPSNFVPATLLLFLSPVFLDGERQSRRAKEPVKLNHVQP
jgi:hypothetical protein